MPEIITREQYLCYGMMVFGKQLIIRIHQLALANGRSGLLGRDIHRALLQAQLTNAHADSTGGNQNDLMPGIFDIADRTAKLLGALHNL